MRISDWSSDVCSSDLDKRPIGLREPDPDRYREGQHRRDEQLDREQYLIGRDFHRLTRSACRNAPIRPSNSRRTRVAVSMSSTGRRSEEHTSELQSLMRISYAVFCLKKKHKKTQT